MHTTLVTGATGNVGRHVVRELLARGADVRVFARDPDAARALLGDVECVAGDFDDPASIRRALDGVARVYVSAADGPRKVAHENAVIDAAVEAGVAQVVKLSAMHADVRSPLPAFAWHGQVEAHLTTAAVPWTIVRPGFFMANLLMVAPGVAHTDSLFAPTAGAKVAMIDLADVGAAVAAVLTGDDHAGRTYELTGDAVTFDDVAAALTEVTGRSIRSVDLTPEEARPRFENADIPDWLGLHLAGVFALIRDGELAQTTDDVARLTGRPPRTVLDFARDHAPLFSA